MNNLPYNWLIPNWDAPQNIRAVTTTRQGGVSLPPFDSMNLGDHVNDDADAVQRNREILIHTLGLPEQPVWLNQIHSNLVSNLDDPQPLIDADAAFTTQKNKACVVMTADCLPVLFCNTQGTVVAASHAGWRGLHAGILEKTVEAMHEPPEQIMAWLGPAIGVNAFEVGEEVREAFISAQTQAEQAFKPKPNGKWLADIYTLARLRLEAIGVKQIYGGGECTYSDAERFYSYRRNPSTGRMASLIWIE